MKAPTLLLRFYYFFIFCAMDKVDFDLIFDAVKYERMHTSNKVLD